MTTTLKLDWPAARTEAVLAVLERPDTILLDPQRSTIWNDLNFFRGVEATIKVDWPVAWIDEVARMLEAQQRGSLHENPELVAAIRDIRGYQEAVAAIAQGFTVEAGLAWLGIPEDTYGESARILRGRHGNPIEAALLDARKAQGTSTTPAEVLAKHGIDPADPLVAVRAFDQARARLD